VIFWPELDLTNSLLMKRPVGKVIFVPLGAVRSTERFDIVTDCEARWVSGEVGWIVVGVRVRRRCTGVKKEEGELLRMR
jgi:hypothetical protein